MLRKKVQVSRQESARRKLLSHTDPKSPIAEQYRTLRTNIQYTSIESTLQTILVTSSAPSEGKSTTIANLAIVLAQQENRVLLVDADLRKPTVHFTFRANNLVGLSSVLTGQVRLADAIVPTEVPNLSVMTCGPIPPNPSELLGSKMMEQAMAELSKSYDYILFDTPPLLAVADAQILANLCDGSILVVKSGSTERESAIKAKELLEQSNAKLLGAVLNEREKKSNTYYYYYGNS